MTDPDVDALAMLEPWYRSWQRQLDDRLYFPRYPERGEREQPEMSCHWWRFPDREAIDAALCDGGPVSLYEAAVLIGDRILRRPHALIVNAPELFAYAWLRGEIDPRSPGALIRYSDHPGEVPDLTWKLYPAEVDAFALKRWGSAVFASDGASPNGASPNGEPATETDPAPRGRSPDLRYRNAHFLAEENRKAGMKKAAAIAAAIEDAYPDATESERTRAANRLNEDLKPSKTPAWAKLPAPGAP